MAQNARQFLDEIAKTLRDKGRPVVITETEENFGTFVWLSSISSHWYDRPMSLSAVKSSRTGRWSLGRFRVGSSVGGAKEFTRTGRTEIRIAAEVYA
jgi:hypothetical protein